MPEVFKKRFQFTLGPAQEPSDFIAAALTSWLRDKSPDSPTLAGSEPMRASGRFGTVLWRPFSDQKGWIHDFVLREDDSRNKVKWHTSVCAYSKSSRNFIEIVVSNDGPERSDPKAVLTGRPKLLLWLVKKVHIWADECPMDSSAIRKRDYEISDFVRYDLLDSTRRFPIILLTSHRDGRFPREFDPAMIARQSTGLARVYFIQEESAMWTLAQEMGGNQLSAFDGAARCYLPGFRLNSNPLEHPLIFPRQFSPKSAARFWNWLSANTIKSHVPDSYIDDRRSDRDYHESFERRNLLVERKKALEKAKGEEDYQRLAQLYADENSQLKAEIDGLKEDIEILADERRTLLSRIGFYQSRVRELENSPAPQDAADIILLPPTSILDAVQKAKVQFSGHIRFCPAAFKSAEDSPYEDPQRVSEIFKAMADVGSESKRSGLGRGLKAAFRELGFEYKSGISEGTSKKLRQQYKISDGKQEFECHEHIRLGTTYDPTECIVVYFVFVSKEHCFVVGHVGKHFENMTST